jgi:hypothetical protein
MSFSLLSQTQNLQNELLDKKKNSKNYMNYKRKKKEKMMKQKVISRVNLKLSLGFLHVLHYVQFLFNCLS